MPANKPEWERLASKLAEELGGAACLHPQVRAYLEAGACRRILVAVSGGADSVCLLWLLCSLRESYGYELRVAHYNHAWREAASDKDAEFVKDLADRLGCPFFEETCTDPSIPHTETAARGLRLAFLRRVALQNDCSSIAYGHQANDVFETQLLRLSRGSGTEGLAAPKPLHVFPDAPTHMRPLLLLSADAIRQAMGEAGLAWREDESNANLEIARNAVRHQVVPVLSKSMNRDILAGAIRSQALLEEDAAALRALAKEYFSEAFASARSLAREALRRHPVALVRRALTEWLHRHDLLGSISATAVDNLLASLRSDAKCVRQSLGAAFVVANEKTVLIDRGEDTATLQNVYTLRCGEALKLPNGGVLSMARVRVDQALQARLSSRLILPETEAYLADLGEESFRVRGWEPGDRFRPLGAPGEKKLKEWFLDRRIPILERRSLPIVCNQCGEILWVPGLPPANARKILTVTKSALRLTYEPPNPT